MRDRLEASSDRFPLRATTRRRVRPRRSTALVSIVRA